MSGNVAGGMKAAVWVRISKEDEDMPEAPTSHLENQLGQLRELADRRKLDVVKVYEVSASAFQGAHLKQLSQVYQDARAGKFSILLVWAIDRLSRQGSMATLQIFDRFTHLGVNIVSLTEPWTEDVAGLPPEFKEVFIAFVGAFAKSESKKISIRTKAGLQRALSKGKTLGRPVGSKDKRWRKRSGYFSRYAK